MGLLPRRGAAMGARRARALPARYVPAPRPRGRPRGKGDPGRRPRPGSAHLPPAPRACGVGSERRTLSGVRALGATSAYDALYAALALADPQMQREGKGPGEARLLGRRGKR